MKHARWVILLSVVLLVGCRTVPIESRVGSVCLATDTMILFDLPESPRTDMEIDERATGVLRAGDQYEVRDHYQLVHERYRCGRTIPTRTYSKPWVLLVSREDPGIRGWIRVSNVQGEIAK